MKQVQLYETIDGERFKSLKQAVRHEDMVKDVRKLNGKILPKKFDTCDFSNGEGYLQYTQEEVKALQRELWQLIEKYHPKLYGETKNSCELISYYIGRHLDDGQSSLYGTWCLLSNVDDKNRLWGQRYYALNPDKAKKVRLN